MGAIRDMIAKDRVAWRAEAKRLETALRQIRSLDEKNVPKYAQQIARDALKTRQVSSHHQALEE